MPVQTTQAMKNWSLIKYTHLSPKSQLTIPVAILRQLGWQPKTRLVIERVKRHIVIRPANP